MIWHLGKLREDAPWLCGVVFGGGSSDSTSSSSSTETTTEQDQRAGAETGGYAASGGATLNVTNNDLSSAVVDAAITGENNAVNSALNANIDVTLANLAAFEQTLTQSLGLASSAVNASAAAASQSQGLAAQILEQSDPTLSGLKLVIVAVALVAGVYFLSKGN